MGEYKIGVLSDYEMEHMPDAGKKVMGRIAAGGAPADSDIKELAGHIKEMRGRDMFDSPQLQRQLQKIKNGK